jgi:nucleoside-diphosphate-sugar epimerase
MTVDHAKCERVASVLHPVILEDIHSVIEQTPALKRLAGKTILVTGAGGMLASYLSYTVAVLNESFLEQPCRLLAATRREGQSYRRLAPLVESDPLAGPTRVQFVTMDCADPNIAIDPPVHFVIHAASPASPIDYLDRPLDTARANTLGLLALLETARANPIESFLFISSGQIYGSPSDRFVPTPESYAGEIDPLAERSCYDEAKRFGETLCAIYCRQYGVPARIARPFQVYGPGLAESDKRAFAEFTCLAAAGRPIVLRSDGTARRTYCYLSDATVALWHVLLEGKPLQAYNVGCSEPVLTIRELAELVAGMADPPVKVIQRKSANDRHLAGSPVVTCPDVRKVSRLIGWQPRIGPAEGFQRTLRWLRNGVAKKGRSR